jgi:hypothetical protein
MKWISGFFGGIGVTTIVLTVLSAPPILDATDLNNVQRGCDAEGGVLFAQFKGFGEVEIHCKNGTEKCMEVEK